MKYISLWWLVNWKRIYYSFTIRGLLFLTVLSGSHVIEQVKLIWTMLIGSFWCWLLELFINTATVYLCIIFFLSLFRKPKFNPNFGKKLSQNTTLFNWYTCFYYRKVCNSLIPWMCSFFSYTFICVYSKNPVTYYCCNVELMPLSGIWYCRFFSKCLHLFELWDFSALFKCKTSLTFLYWMKSHLDIGNNVCKMSKKYFHHTHLLKVWLPVFSNWFNLCTLHSIKWCILQEVWQSSRWLFLIMFGIPTGVISIVCYSLCCMDTVDDEIHSDEEDSEDEDYRQYLKGNQFLLSTWSGQLREHCKPDLIDEIVDTVYTGILCTRFRP